MKFEFYITTEDLFATSGEKDDETILSSNLPLFYRQRFENNTITTVNNRVTQL